MYLSSLYGPVYLVSHIVTMYVMPELGLIIALEPSWESGYQTIETHPVTTAVHVTMPFFFCQLTMTSSDSSSVKKNKLEMDASLMCGWKKVIWTLLFHSSFHSNFAFFLFLIYSFVLSPPCCVGPSRRVTGGTCACSTRCTEQMVPLFQPFCLSVSIIFLNLSHGFAASRRIRVPLE